MTRQEIDRIFRKTFNNKTNFITPYIVTRGKKKNYLYELSWGESIFDSMKKIYGVTILTLDGETTDLSEGGFTQEEAYKYIATFKES